MEIEEYLPLDGSCDSNKFEVYHCSNYECFEHIIKPLPKFKIKIEVEDDTDSTHLILLHDQAVQVLNKSAAELLKDNESVYFQFIILLFYNIYFNICKILTDRWIFNISKGD